MEVIHDQKGCGLPWKQAHPKSVDRHQFDSSVEDLWLKPRLQSVGVISTPLLVIRYPITVIEILTLISIFVFILIEHILSSELQVHILVGFWTSSLIGLIGAAWEVLTSLVFME